MTLDKYLGIEPPKYWRPPTNKELKSKCWFNNEVMRVLGSKASCYDPSNGYCGGECKWGPHCHDCGKARVYSDDQCSGRALICINPECTTDK